MLKIHVTDLGRIATAEVELSPLLILVGKNNTGKSYLATLMWALGELRMFGPAVGRRPAWFTAFMRPHEEAEPRRLTVDAVKAEEIRAWVNRMLDRQGADFLSNIFAYKGFQHTKVSILDTAFEPFELTHEVVQNRKPSLTDEKEFKFSYSYGGNQQVIFIVPQQLLNGGKSWIPQFMYYEMVGYTLFGPSWEAYRRQTYIPATRTGIMLALPALISQALSPANEDERLPLPRPLLAFLRQMARPPLTRTSQRKESPIGARLKQKLVRGQISSSTGPAPDFKYTPEGVDISLPLHATSSMITELAPFMVALERSAERQHLVFEEPEAHLHLEAQREMARLIARLVSSGTRVTLTTHSDTFLQQINNLMTLYTHPQRDQKMVQLGYEMDDLIDPEKVNAYEFCPESNGTEVRKLEKGHEGFVVSTLNETLLALARETIALRSDVDA